MLHNEFKSFKIKKIIILINIGAQRVMHTTLGAIGALWYKGSDLTQIQTLRALRFSEGELGSKLSSSTPIVDWIPSNDKEQQNHYMTNFCVMVPLDM